jgi:hypothetical protein
MTYESQYELKACGPSTQRGLTLYEARKSLLAAVEAGHTGDASHISRGGRCVGFYNAWTETVMPMFGAHLKEEHVLSMWEGPRARPWRD